MRYAVKPAAIVSRLNGHAGSVRLAAIDVGSNSIHMTIAQADSDGSVTTLWRAKEMVGLGRISFPSRWLSAEAMNRAFVTLRRFVEEAHHRRCEQILAVATSAVREAENGGAFIERVRRELGVHVRVVSARGEAELIYLGVRHALGLERGPHLIIDIGGGSVEFIVGDHQKAYLLESRKLGAARMTARFVKSDPIDESELKALLRHYDLELTPIIAAISKLSPVGVIGTSGTIENLALMCGESLTQENGNGQASAVLPRRPLERIVHRLLESRSKDRERIKGLDEQRKDQILAGALLAHELFERLDIEQIELCRSALREGLLIQHLAEHRPEMEIRRDVPDPRRREILDLARRCHFHHEHAEQVARLCLSLFDQTRAAGLHDLGPRQRDLVEYGALLHDIGYLIGRDRHHKHSAYLIRNGGLEHFSPEEVAIIACIARYHRGVAPQSRHRLFTSLSRKGQRAVRVGAALLRVADGLDRTNCAVVAGVRCRVGRRRFRVTATTRGDAQLEAWSAKARGGLFQVVFDRRLDLAVKER